MEDYDEDALLTARNKLVTAHLALDAIAEGDALLSIKCVLDEAMCDLDRGLKLNAA
jgi:hypothetical protein